MQNKLENMPLAIVLAQVEGAPPLGQPLNAVGDEHTWYRRAGAIYREYREQRIGRALSALEVYQFGHDLASAMVVPPELTYEPSALSPAERHRRWSDVLHLVVQSAMRGDAQDRKWLLEQIAVIAEAVAAVDRPSLPPAKVQGEQEGQTPLIYKDEVGSLHADEAGPLHADEGADPSLQASETANRDYGFSVSAEELQEQNRKTEAVRARNERKTKTGRKK